MSERLYYSESFLASFEARVSDVREVSRSQGQSLWQLALDRTAFYPSSGGQPHDVGTLAAVSPSGVRLSAPVLAVEEDEEGVIWHTTAKPLNAGTPVTGQIDWHRRQDHMQQHSGQHLLSAVLLRENHAPTVSFHLGETASTIDLAVESISAEDLWKAEDLANQIIAEDRPVRTRTASREEATELLASGVLRKLPERDGAIRLIEIADLDLNACGGTHVRSTGQIGGLLISGTERVRQGLRIEFVCGLRAVHSARRERTSLARSASALSVGRLQVPDAVDRLIADEKASVKQKQRLEEELADYHAARLLVESPIDDGLRIVRRTFADRAPAYVKLLASRLTASAPQTVALLSSAAQEPAKVVIAAGQDLEVNCGALLRQALAAFGERGGGSSTLAQGQISGAQLDALFDAIEASLRKP
ncbi:MAG TPA: alanine--tRNA ligase-related protein [Acidobacteriaceae bacterium]|nr:alanine--tRNA ligase-related protein [Acidobacteriaceae bacterium]